MTASFFLRHLFASIQYIQYMNLVFCDPLSGFLVQQCVVFRHGSCHVPTTARSASACRQSWGHNTGLIKHQVGPPASHQRRPMSWCVPLGPFSPLAGWSASSDTTCGNTATDGNTQEDGHIAVRIGTMINPELRLMVWYTSLPPRKDAFGMQIKPKGAFYYWVYDTTIRTRDIYQHLTPAVPWIACDCMGWRVWLRCSEVKNKWFRLLQQVLVCRTVSSTMQRTNGYTGSKYICENNFQIDLLGDFQVLPALLLLEPQLIIMNSPNGSCCCFQAPKMWKHLGLGDHQHSAEPGLCAGNIRAKQRSNWKARSPNIFTAKALCTWSHTRGQNKFLWRSTGPVDGMDGMV